jgi:hypothetical protein
MIHKGTAKANRNLWLNTREWADLNIMSFSYSYLFQIQLIQTPILIKTFEYQPDWHLCSNSSGSHFTWWGWNQHVYVYTVELSYSNIVFCDTLPIASNTQWYELIPHKATVFIPCLV